MVNLAKWAASFFCVVAMINLIATVQGPRAECASTTKARPTSDALEQNKPKT